MYVSKPPLVQCCGFADAFWCCLLMVLNLILPLSSQPPNHCAVSLSFGGGVAVTFLWWPWGGGGLAAGCYYDGKLGIAGVLVAPVVHRAAGVFQRYQSMW